MIRFLFCFLLCVSLQAGDWPSFRGSDASGVADGANLPDTWNGEANTHIRWKTPIPGLAHSSPIVWGKKVLVSSAISSKEGDAYLKPGLYGSGEAAEDVSSHRFSMFCLDSDSGKVLWETTVYEGAPKEKRHVKATYANATPATNGTHVVVSFGSMGLYCLDMNGKLLWKKDLGVLNLGAYDYPEYEWGSASSPIIYKDMAIIQCDTQNLSFVLACSLKDGKTLWKAERDELPSWSTPTVYTASDRHELLTNAPNFIRAYDPKTGKELWRLGGSSKITAPTPIFRKDRIVIASGRRPVKPIFLLKPGGNGDITLAEDASSSDHVVWRKTGVGSYMPTPIIYGDLLYSLNNNGVFDCYDLETGESKYRQRVAHGGSGFSASPVAADGKIYLPSEDGDIFVVKAGPKFELLAQNSLGEIVMASPALANNTLYVRARRHLFAVGK